MRPPPLCALLTRSLNPGEHTADSAAADQTELTSEDRFEGLLSELLQMDQERWIVIGEVAANPWTLAHIRHLMALPTEIVDLLR